MPPSYDVQRDVSDLREELQTERLEIYRRLDMILSQASEDRKEFQLVKGRVGTIETRLQLIWGALAAGLPILGTYLFNLFFGGRSDG